MDWTLDFCLSCDRQTSNGAYCSQSCRLMDIERAGLNSPTIVMATAPVSRTTPAFTYPSAAPNVGSAFCLPPPVDFAACRSSGKYAKSTPLTGTTSISPTTYNSSSNHQAPHLQYLSTTPSTANPFAYSQARSPMLSPLLETSSGKGSCFDGSSLERRLTPSSSGISLSSMRSVSSCQSLSDQTRAQLQIYVSSFDSTRDVKRRATLG